MTSLIISALFLIVYQGECPGAAYFIDAYDEVDIIEGHVLVEGCSVPFTVEFDETDIEAKYRRLKGE